MSLQTGGRTVREDGKDVAYLSYSGRVITVRRPDDTVAGRLIRTTDSGPERYDTWTAMHPAAATPSDKLLGSGLPMAEAIGLVLHQLKAAC